jgi:hypothetical protein
VALHSLAIQMLVALHSLAIQMLVALHFLAIQMLAAALALAVAHTWVRCSRLQAACSGGWVAGLFSGAGAEMEAAGACLEEAAGACLEEAVF